MILETRRVFIKSENMISFCIAIRQGQDSEILLVDCESKPPYSTINPHEWVAPQLRSAHKYLRKSLNTKAPASDKMLWDILPEDILVDLEYIAHQEAISKRDFLS